VQVSILIAQFVIACALAIAVTHAFYRSRAVLPRVTEKNAQAAAARAWRDILLAVLALLVVAVLMTSCTSGSAYWTKPGASEAEMARHRSECEYEAEKATPPSSTTGDAFADGLATGSHKAELQRMCLKLRGFQPPTKS